MVRYENKQCTESWWPRTRHWVERHYHATAVVYHTTFVISALIAAVTLVVNYANKAPNKGQTPDVVEPFGKLLSDNIYRVLLDYRWPILGCCVVLIAVPVASQIVTLRRRLYSISHLDVIWAEYSGILAEIRAFDLKSAYFDNAELARNEALLASSIKAFLARSQTRIAILFREFTGRECRVSIRLFEPETKRVRTLSRDFVTIQNGDYHDSDWYPYQDDSTFIEIYDFRKTFFLCNYLRISEFFGRYKNRNADWRKAYRARLAVPIAATEPGEPIQQDSIWGFLTIDNKRGGFDRLASVALAQSFARVYYSVLAETSALQSEREPES